MSRAASAEPGRGRSAERPEQIPARGWVDVLWRVKDQVAEDNLSHIAAGVAFYWLLALVPALVVLISIYGLVADPAQLERQLLSLADVLPDYARELLRTQLASIVGGSSKALSFGVAAGVLFSLWSATKGVNALIVALNIAYDEEEKRGFIRLTLTAVALTLGLIVFFAVSLGLVVALPAIVGWLPIGRTAQDLLLLVRWPLLAVAMAVALAATYHFAPSRRGARWRWVSWGAGAATALWLVVSAGFALYVSNFGSYNETYGSLGAVVFLLMWFWLSAYVVLLGAELNAELERQTERDTTEGPERPRGRRRAHAADTVGEARG